MDMDNEWHEKASVDWNYDNKHYLPILCIHTRRNAGDQGKINRVLFYSDPYNIITDVYTEYEEVPDNRVYDLQLVATKVSINTMGNRKLYGYDVDNIVTTAAKYSFLADDTLSEVHLPNNLNIYLLNMQLESYDNYKGDREDILMSLPALNYINNRFIYSGIPIFIDINNIEAMNLTQLYIELKEYDGTYLKTIQNGCDMTLLIRDRIRY
jgi:hypothetical protein